MSDEFPELDNEAWDRAHQGASAHGLQGLTRALHLTVVAISNTRSQIGGQVGYLKSEIKTLNARLEEFNKSSELLTRKAINLTKWIMIATIVSSLATAVLAIDVIIKWLHP
jgi:hypothetical protein